MTVLDAKGLEFGESACRVWLVAERSYWTGWAGSLACSECTCCVALLCYRSRVRFPFILHAAS